eukprot:scaffold763_cov403-Pavlova_lutheri.AAC.7
MDSYSSMERSRAASQAPPQPPRQLPPHRRSSRARSFTPNSKKDYHARRENVRVRFKLCGRVRGGRVTSGHLGFHGNFTGA